MAKNVALKLQGKVGVNTEYVRDWVNQEAWTSVGQFDDVDGTDSDTQMRLQYQVGGSSIFFKTYEGADATIEWTANTLEDIGPLRFVPGNKYVVSFKIDSFVDEPDVNGTRCVLYLGSSESPTNSVNVLNQQGLVEAVVTCSENELHVKGFSDVFGYFAINYLSIRDYNENEVLDTFDLDADLSFPLNYQVDDISDPSKKKTNYSKTITLPGTRNNNRIFENVFDIETDLSVKTWNPNKKLNIVVIEDTIETFRGILKLDNIKLNSLKQVEYEVTLLSSITDIFTELRDRELRDLNFSEYDHDYTAENQFNSWGPEFGGGTSGGFIKKGGQPYVNFYTSGPNYPNPTGEGYVYPVLDNGKISWTDLGFAGNAIMTGPFVRVEDMTPAIYLREYISKIFQSVGYTWTSELLDSNMFRKLVILPTNEQLRMSQADIDKRLFKILSTQYYHNNANHPQLYFSELNAGTQILDFVRYTDETGTGAHDTVPVASYDNSTFGKWIVNKGGTYSFKAKIGLEWFLENLKDIDGNPVDGSSPVFANFLLENAELQVRRWDVNNSLTTILATAQIDMTRYSTAITAATFTTPTYEFEVNVDSAELMVGDEVYVTLNSRHILQTDFNNTTVDGDITPQGTFYRVMPAAANAVIAILNNSPEIGNTTGDRYLIGPNPLALDDWNGKSGQIATKNSGAGWSYEDPAIYTQVLVTNLNYHYIRTGTGYGWEIARPDYVSYMPTHWRAGQTMIWDFYDDTEVNTGAGTAKLNMKAGYFFQNNIASTDITEGSVMGLNAAIPDGVKQTDLLKSVFTMFNCYVTEDPNDSKNLIIEPRKDFYSSDNVDWSQKLDYTQEIEITPMSELNAKEYHFTYKGDNDYINAHYLKNYSDLPYGSKKLTVDNDFLDEIKKIELIFGPTPVWKRMTNRCSLPSMITEDNKPFKNNLRIMFYNGKEATESFVHVFEGGGTQRVARQLPGFNMDNDMFNPTLSLKWGQDGTEYYWNSQDGNTSYNRTNNTLYNVYYYDYFKEILDVNSKLIAAYFDLRAVDILNLDFRKLYFFDGHWCRLYKVENYDPFKNQTTKCYFLKYTEGIGFEAQYSNNFAIGGGREVISQDWDIIGGSGATRLEENTLRGTDIASQGGSFYREMSYQYAEGQNNVIAQSAQRVNVIGDNNTIFDDVSKVSLLNTDNTIVNAGVKNSTVENSNNIEIGTGAESIAVKNSSNVIIAPGVTNTTIENYNPTVVTTITQSNTTIINSITVTEGGIESETGLIVTVEITYAELAALKTAETLSPNTFYKITDRGDQGIVIKAIDNSSLDHIGVRFMNCPTQSLYTKTTEDSPAGNNLGVWHAGLTVIEGNTTIWGGRVWINLLGNVGAYVDDYILDTSSPAEWEVVEKPTYGESNSYYETLQFDVKYDFDNDWIYEQSDNKGNIFGLSYQDNLDEFGFSFNPVDITDWNIYFLLSNNCLGCWNNSSNGSISYNHSKYGAIFRNSNDGNIIKNYNFNEISDNSNIGNIEKNIISGNIQQNTNNGSILYNSNKGNIGNNDNNGDITYNSNSGNILSNGVLVTDVIYNSTSLNIINSSVTGILTDMYKVVSSISDLPTPVMGVITLLDNVTYLFNQVVDLDSNRLVCGQNTTILGGSSENCRIKSTGLSASTALITSAWSLPMRSITIEHGTALDLDATANANQALDFTGVNFTDCATVGTIDTYNNVIFTNCAFLNSGALTFDGTIQTIGFSSCLFDTAATKTALILPSTLTISRRFRAIYSSFVTGTGETGINVSTSATIPDEGYILDTINFSGAGTYITGIDHTYNEGLFVNCRGITNTGYISQYYMTGNATATVIGTTGTFVKIAGTTTSGSYVEKFTNTTTNRATYDGSLVGYFRVTAILSCTTNNNNVVTARIGKNGTTSASSSAKITASGTGDFENMKVQDVVLLTTGDYIEIFITNNTATNNITVGELNVIIERLN